MVDGTATRCFNKSCAMSLKERQNNNSLRSTGSPEAIREIFVCYLAALKYCVLL
jgi:hypothetical protein